MVRTLLFALSLFITCGGQVAGSGDAANDAGADSNTACVIHATSYDQSCSMDADCTGVFDGNACATMCACENAAINRSARARYQADFPQTDAGQLCPCPPALVTCQNGTCAPCNDPLCFKRH